MTGIILTLFLLLGNAYFVAVEFSLISARRDRLETLYEQGKRRAKTVMGAGEHLSLMLAGCQFGITICSIILGKISEPAIAHLIESPLDLVRVPQELLHPIAFAIALLLVVVLHILIGEMVPKNIALAGPERAAMVLVPPHLMIVKVMRPFISVFNLLANSTMRLVHVEPKDELNESVSRSQLTALIGESHEEGFLDEEEHERLNRALRSNARIVSDVEIPLAKVRSVPLRSSSDGSVGPRLGDIEIAVAETGFSRYPVRGLSGGLVGYLHLKDVLTEMRDDSVSADSIIGSARIRALPAVQRDMAIDVAMTLLRREESHLGACVDGNGMTTGIIALEDMVEEFVGTVRDATHRE